VAGQGRSSGPLTGLHLRKQALAPLLAPGLQRAIRQAMVPGQGSVPAGVPWCTGSDGAL